MNSKKEIFEHYYIEAHDDLARYCQAICGNSVDAKDLIHDSVLKAYQTFDRVEKKASFSYYLIAIARGIYLNQQRRLKFWRSWPAREVRQMGSEDNDAETGLQVQELYRALSQLPYKQREAIILSEISGYKIREIAELQQVGISAVKSNIRRGKQKLRAMLTDESIGEKKVKL